MRLYVKLPEAVVIDRLGNILARSEYALSSVIEEIPPNLFESVNKGEVTLLGSEQDDKVRALVRLNRFVDAYLLVERFVDPRVIQHIARIRQAVDEYKKLERNAEWGADKLCTYLHNCCGHFTFSRNLDWHDGSCTGCSPRE